MNVWGTWFGVESGMVGWQNGWKLIPVACKAIGGFYLFYKTIRGGLDVGLVVVKLIVPNF